MLVRTEYRGSERRAITFLRRAPLERRRGGWRFGAACVGDVIVERLVADGVARIRGNRVEIIEEARDA